MKCEKCGTEIPSGAKLCPKCKAGASSPKANVAPKNIPQSPQNNQQQPDIDFDRKYYMMFEDDVQNINKGYEVDESLKQKRTARYDESFSDMTDDEKIKALEAARQARKEKRERKNNKNSSVDSVRSMDNDREKKIDVKAGVASKTSAMKDIFASRLNKSQGSEKPLAEIASRQTEKRPRAKKNLKMSSKTGLVIGGVVAVLVIAVIIVSVNMASRVSTVGVTNPTVYEKDNNLYSYYNGKAIELSQNFIESTYQDEAEVPNASPGAATAEPRPYFEPAKEKDLITFTDNGASMYFIDNADLNRNGGTLKYSQSGNKNGTVTIASDVYYDICISENGSGVLFLSGTDAHGYGGTLNYWSSVSKNVTELSQGVMPYHFLFGQNDSIIYLTEYNDEYKVGDLYLVPVNKGEVTETKKIDSDVYEAFGTNSNGKSVVYAKDYNKDNECFNIYLMREEDSEPIMVTENSRCEPIFMKNSEEMYVGGSYEDYYQSLYYASLTSGEKEKIASGLTEMVKMSKDENAVIFRKANAEGTAFDYFYANKSALEAQLVGDNVTVLDDENHKRVSQFEINDDFTRVAFIRGYDFAVESGGLYIASITNGVVGSDKKISDTVHSCNITPDGLTVRYADNYDITWNLVTLNAYTGDTNKVLASEVGAGAFTFDKSGSYTVYAKNYSLETRTGDVYCVDNKGKTNEVVRGVSSYGLKGNGDIIYYNKQNNLSSFQLNFTRPDGKKTKTIDKDVTNIVSY